MYNYSFIFDVYFIYYFVASIVLLTIRILYIVVILPLSTKRIASLADSMSTTTYKHLNY